MIYVTREDSIDTLRLSNRTTNCLRREGINTIGQVLDAPADSWSGIRNMGEKSITELKAVVAQFQPGGSLTLVDSKPQPTAPKPTLRLLDIPIQRLGLSVRAVNCLTAAGFKTAVDLSGVTKDSLLSIKNMGTKTAQEILDRLEQLWEEAVPARAQTSADCVSEPESDSLWHRAAREFSTFTGLPLGDLIRRLSEFYEQHPDADEGALCALLYADASVRSAVCRVLLHLLARREDGMTRQALLEHLPAHTAPETLDELLSELEQKKEIDCLGELVERRYSTALEYIENLKNERDRDILLTRLHGATLEEAGRPYDLSRERVRQRTQRELSRRPRLYEDKYRYLFDHYEFSLEEFRLAFAEPDEAYNYLEMTRPKGERKPIQELLADESVPIPLRRRAERAVYKQYVTIDGIRVRKNRPELAHFAVRAYCQDLTSMDAFIQRYHAMLRALGLEHDPSLIIDSHSYENKFQICDYILWNQGHQFRYYSIGEQDYETLLDTLNLEQHEDQEISTLKLFRDHTELMEEYDIRDEYELHNLLKKIWPEERIQVHFKKMPTIEIGTPDRDRQVMDLLIQYAPISNVELAERYEETYGAKSATVLANYFSCIEPYLHNRVYRIDLPPLSKARHDRMAELLTGDFYRMTEIRRLYLQKFPGSDPADLNPFSLKQLGYRAYPDYVVSTRFSSASNYFHHLLTSGDTVDMREIAPKFSTIKAYWLELASLKNQRTIIEFEPKQYINIRRLQACGVTIDDLEDYCSAVCAAVRPGGYFTVASLRQEGFTHRLDDLGFGGWFYGSVLAVDQDHLSYQRLGNTRIFFRGTVKGYLKTTDFLRWLVEAEGRMDVYDLHKKLHQQYGVELPFHKLTELIYNSDLYYDSIMEAVYVDYDTYLEEI